MGLTYPNFITNDLVRCDAKFILGNLAEMIKLLPFIRKAIVSN
jgi:hypothetical protein